MTEAAEIVVVFCTVPDQATGRDIARKLIAQRQAACVNLLPGVESVYRWEGEMHFDAECLMMIKSTKDRYSALQAAIVALHPAELPEVIAVPLSNGLAEYLNWVRTETL